MYARIESILFYFSAEWNTLRGSEEVEGGRRCSGTGGGNEGDDGGDGEEAGGEGGGSEEAGGEVGGGCEEAGGEN